MTLADRYLQRIGFTGEVHLDVETLDRIVAAHAASIPFENIASFTAGPVVFPGPVSLAPQAIADKMLDPAAPRGGYCLEHSGLLYAALSELGFTVRQVLGRIYLDPDSGPTGRTHNVVFVTIDGHDRLVDVGVGGLAPTASLDLAISDPQPTPHGFYRIVPMEADGAGRPLADVMVQAQINTADGARWVDMYGLSFDPVTDNDLDLANWWIATSERSIFTRTFAAALAPADGTRVTISGRKLRHRAADGTSTVSDIANPDQLRNALADTGVRVDDSVLESLFARLDETLGAVAG